MKEPLSLLTATLVLAVCLSAPAETTPAPGILIQPGQKVAFMGDSITANGWGQPGGYVKLIVEGLAKEGVKIDPIPAGVSGNTSRDMLARLQADVISKKPDWMTLSCGVNDVWHGAAGVDLETYKKNITSIIEQATAAGIKVIVLTATPIGEDSNGNNKKLGDYNQFLRQLAHERKLPLADLNAEFHAILDPLKPTNTSRDLTVDGVHMNPDGNIVMARGVLGAMGVPDADLAKLEQGWLAEPNTAFLSAGNFELHMPGTGITLAQFRAIKAEATQRGLNFEQVANSLWLQALGEAMQAHLQDSLVDLDAVRKDANARFAQKIDEASKGTATTTK